MNLSVLLHIKITCSLVKIDEQSHKILSWLRKLNISGSYKGNNQSFDSFIRDKNITILNITDYQAQKSKLFHSNIINYSFIDINLNQSQSIENDLREIFSFVNRHFSKVNFLIQNGCEFIFSGSGIDSNLEMVEESQLFQMGFDLSLRKSNIEDYTNLVAKDECLKKIKYSVTVLIPTYNRLETLKKCLQCIENQSYNKDQLEILIVNDGSTDNTENYLMDYQKTTSFNLNYLYQKNSGPAKARNYGIREAQGEIIILIGDDILIESYFIEKHVQFHKDYPQLSYCCLGFTDWSKEIEITPFMRHITSLEGGEQFNYKYLEKYHNQNNVDYNFFVTSNISCKTLFYRTFGLFDHDAFKDALWEDIELGYRFSLVGLKLHYKKYCLAYHEHPGINQFNFCKRQRKAGQYITKIERLIPIFFKLNINPQCYNEKTLQWLMQIDFSLNNVPFRLLGLYYKFLLDYAFKLGYSEKLKINDENKGLTNRCIVQKAQLAFFLFIKKLSKKATLNKGFFLIFSFLLLVYQLLKRCILYSKMKNIKA